MSGAVTPAIGSYSVPTPSDGMQLCKQCLVRGSQYTIIAYFGPFGSLEIVVVIVAFVVMSWLHLAGQGF